MAITRIGTPTTGGNGTATSLALALPAGCKAGDIAVYQLYVESTGTIVSADGFVLVRRISNTTSGNAFDQAIYVKRLTSDQSGNITFTFPSAWCAGSLVVYRGVIQIGRPWDRDTSVFATAAAGTSVTVNKIIPNKDGVLCVGIAGFAGGGYGGPSGFFEVTDFADVAFYELLPYKTRGDGTGTLTATATNSQTLASIMFLLMDAQADRRRAA